MKIHVHFVNFAILYCRTHTNCHLDSLFLDVSVIDTLKRALAKEASNQASLEQRVHKLHFARVTGEFSVWEPSTSQSLSRLDELLAAISMQDNQRASLPLSERFAICTRGFDHEDSLVRELALSSLRTLLHEVQSQILDSLVGPAALGAEIESTLKDLIYKVMPYL